MAWKCPQCGFVHEDGAVLRCEACGFTRSGRLVLVAEATAKRLSVGVDTAIGKHLLQTSRAPTTCTPAEPAVPPRARPGEGGWTVAPAPGTKNPTFLNGAALGDAPAPLAAGR